VPKLNMINSGKIIKMLENIQKINQTIK